MPRRDVVGLARRVRLLAVRESEARPAPDDVSEAGELRAIVGQSLEQPRGSPSAVCDSKQTVYPPSRCSSRTSIPSNAIRSAAVSLEALGIAFPPSRGRLRSRLGPPGPVGIGRTTQS